MAVVSHRTVTFASPVDFILHHYRRCVAPQLSRHHPRAIPETAWSSTHVIWPDFQATSLDGARNQETTYPFSG